MSCSVRGRRVLGVMTMVFEALGRIEEQMGSPRVFRRRERERFGGREDRCRRLVRK